MSEVFFDTLFSQLASGVLNLGVRIIIAVLTLFIGSKLIKYFLKLLRKTLEKGRADTSITQFLCSFAKAALYVVLGFLIAAYCGIDAASIVALLGSAGVAIGLAVQGSLSNMAGGVLILLLKPFKIGDYIIDSEGNEGTVDEIHVIYTKLRTGDNKVIILPNGTLANNSITNVSTSNMRRCDIKVDISYDSDIKLAKETILNILREDEATLKDKDLLVFVDLLGESSIVIGVRCWFNNSDFWPGRWRINEEIKYALDAAGIEIPFRQMDIHIDGNINKL